MDLLRYAARKLLLVLPLLWGVVTLVFILLELSPGTIVDKFVNQDTTPEVRALLMAKWHLDDPAYIRYFYMIRNLATLDLGVSMDRGEPVIDVIKTYLPNTLLLASVTLGVSYPLGITLGTVQAWFQGRKGVDVVDTVVSVNSLFLYSMPSFWYALMLQLVFAYELRGTAFELPSSGMHDAVMFDYMSGSEQLVDRLKHVILPGLMIGIANSGGVARYMRSAVLEVIRQDYVRTARAKGLSEARVVIVHALRNAMLPLITLFGLSLPQLFAGSVLVERVFAWPGMGRAIIDAIMAQDQPMIIGCFFVYALLVATGSVMADLLYAFADPRIRYQG